MNAALLTSRHERLIERLAAHNFDAVAVNPGPSLGYLTGMDFHLSERPVVALFRKDHPPAIILPELELAKLDAVEYEIRSYPYTEELSSWPEAFGAAIRAAELQNARIAVEPGNLRVLELRLLEGAAPGARFESGPEVISDLRVYKDASEVETFRKAVHMAQDALTNTLPLVKEGMTEREFASELTMQLLRQGSEPELPFNPIVAFGAATANPHASPRDEKLRRGDLVLVDWGANLHGYFSDLTRTFAFGEVNPELTKIADIVRQANEAGREASNPGVTAGAVDAAARKVIEDAGYGEYFIHRTGHGLGLESHEEPYIRAGNKTLLQPGMCFTVEPGIYLRGRGGVRIEDDVIITDQGAESLSDLPRDLVRIGYQ